MSGNEPQGLFTINKKTFTEVFPDVELEESTYCLQNFDKRLIKPIGSFRCFLRWKGHKYRVKFEVMGIDTPNLLSRETTFLMGIPKKCLSVEKAPNVVEDVLNNMQNPSLSIPDQTPGHLGHSVPPMEGVFCHSVTSTEGVFSHSVMPAEGNLLCHSVTSTEDRSPKNCASISDRAVLPESDPNSVSGSNNHLLSIADLPLT